MAAAQAAQAAQAAGGEGKRLLVSEWEELFGGEDVSEAEMNDLRSLLAREPSGSTDSNAHKQIKKHNIYVYLYIDIYI